MDRRDLRSMRLLVAGVLAAFVLFAGALVLKAFSDRDQCEADQRILRDRLPAAFETHDQLLGEELGADPERIEEFNSRVRVELHALFPERECDLLGGD